MSDIAVLGAGAFGTALAVSLARDGRKITLWGRNPEQINDMRKGRENAARLPGVALPDGLSVTSDLGDITADVVLMSVPMQQLDRFAAENSAILNGKTLVTCCKGLDLQRELTPAAILAEHCPNSPLAVLSGPSFAVDIAAGMPTALTLAMQDDAEGAKLQSLLSTATLRLYRSDDITGVELGGALKNVIAIACGMAMGAGLGESARAALMTRGYAEMARLAFSLGGRPETMAGLSGFGDLVLTCTSKKSRNYAFGYDMGANSQTAPGVTVEGVATARAVANLSKSAGIDMPITRTVAAILDGNLTLTKAMETLLSRPLKKE